MELQVNTVFDLTPAAAAAAREEGMPEHLSFALGQHGAMPWPGVGDLIKVGDDEAYLFEVIARVFHYRSSIELELGLLLDLPKPTTAASS